MKKKLVIAGVLLMMLLVSCLSQGQKVEIKATKVVTHSVTRETGFYESLASDNFTKTLKEGTRLIKGRCQESIAEISIRMCYVTLVDTNEKGYVLENAID